MFDGNAGSCCQHRRLETRKLGSKPNVLASDPDLDKIRHAPVIGAIVTVGRNCQPRRHSRASSRLPLTSHSFSLSQHPRKTPTTRLWHPLHAIHSSFTRTPTLFDLSIQHLPRSYAPFQDVNIPTELPCRLAHWSCLP